MNKNLILKITLLQGILIFLNLYAAEFPIATITQEQAKPRIAKGENNLLAVWEDSRNSSSKGIDIWGQLVDFNGNLKGSNFFISGDLYNQTSPVTAWGCSLYVVIWMQYIGGSRFNIYGQLVDSNGILKDTAFPISTVAHAQQPAVSFGESCWLVVWADLRNNTDLDIYGQLVNIDGSLKDTAFPISNANNYQLSPAVSWLESKKIWLIGWEDNRDTSITGADIWAQRIDTDGTLLGNNIPICQISGTQQYPSIASNTISWFIVWQDFRSDSAYDVYAQFVDTIGNLINSNFVVAETAGCNLYYPQVIWNGSRFVAVWVRYNKIVTDNMQISNSSKNAWYPGLATVGNNCMVVWQDDRNIINGYDIYANLFTPAGIEENLPQKIINKQELNAFPNPFIAETIIKFENPLPEYSQIRIYDITGKLAKSFSLIPNPQSPVAEITWDGKDIYGKLVKPGIYFCILKGNNKKLIKKLIHM